MELGLSFTANKKWETVIATFTGSNYNISVKNLSFDDSTSALVYHDVKNKDLYFSRVDLKSGVPTASNIVNADTYLYYDAKVLKDGATIITSVGASNNEQLRTIVVNANDETSVLSENTASAFLSPTIVKNESGELEFFASDTENINFYEIDQSSGTSSHITKSIDASFIPTDVAVLENGNIAAVHSYNFSWTVSGADTDALLHVISPVQSEITDAIIVNTWRAGGQWPADILELNDDTFVVIFTSSHEDNQLALWGQKFDLNGNRVGNATKLIDSATYACDSVATEEGFLLFTTSKVSKHEQQTEILKFDNDLELLERSNFELDEESLTPDSYTIAPAGANNYLVTWSARVEEYDAETGLSSFNASLYSSLVFFNYNYSGSVVHLSGKALPNVLISSPNAENIYTSDVGLFSFSTSNEINKIEAALDYDGSSNSKIISSQDALDALRLSVGLSTSSGTHNAADFIAADFNQDGKVSSQDALSILKFSVGLMIDHQPKWVFLDTNADYSGINKSNIAYSEGINSFASEPADQISLTGVLIGDVNDSYGDVIM